MVPLAMTRQLYYRWLQPDEAHLGMEAIGRLWHSGHILARDEQLFRWQYARAKEPDRLGFLIAEDDSAIVGFSGLIVLPWHIHGEAIPGGVGAITVIDPEYRISAAGLTLIAEADRNLQIVGSFGINKRVAKLYELQGRYVIGEFPRRTGLGKWETVEKYLQLYSYPEAQRKEIREKCGKLDMRRMSPAFRVEKLSPGSLAEWDMAWRRHFAPRLAGVGRPGEYVEWRYLNHPRFSYTAMLLRDNADRIRGLTVFRQVDLGHELTALRILDFLARDEEAAHALAHAVSEHYPPNCVYAEFGAPGRQGDALTDIGLSFGGSRFLSVYTSPPDPENCAILSSLLVNVPGHTPKSFAEHEDIYFTLADGDQDRPN